MMAVIPIRAVTSVVLGAALFVAASSVPATAVSPIINGSFETGDLSGWDVNIAPGGNASAATSYSPQTFAGTSYSPQDGNFFGLLRPGGVGVYTMISQPFSADVGDTISGWAFFTAEDYLPFNDEGQVVIKSGGTEIATPFSASVASLGNFSQTGWTRWEYTVTQPGTYRIEARVRNMGDSALPSRLGLDDVSVKSADEELADLDALIRSYGLPASVQDSLLFKVSGARHSLELGRLGDACNRMGDLDRRVNEMLARNRLTSTQATEILAASARIADMLACP